MSATGSEGRDMSEPSSLDDSIPDKYWVAAALKKCDEPVFVKPWNSQGSRAINLSFVFGQVTVGRPIRITREEAQAESELDRKREVSDAQVDASIEWLVTQDAMIAEELPREYFVGIIEAAFNAEVRE